MKSKEFENMIVIVDIDNTLCFNNKRYELATNKSGRVDWDILYDFTNVLSDEPNWQIIENVRKYKSRNFKIVIFTSRPESIRVPTEQWLHKYEIPYDILYMRSLEDMKISHVELKHKMYRTFIDDKVFCAFDDRQDIVELWLNLGIPTFKV